jgi:hypothetical protein
LLHRPAFLLHRPAPLLHRPAPLLHRLAKINPPSISSRVDWALECLL